MPIPGHSADQWIQIASLGEVLAMGCKKHRSKRSRNSTAGSESHSATRV